MNMEPIAFVFVFSVFTVPRIILGIILCCGKGTDLIAGYNTASPSERAKWDEKALCRGTGILLLLMIGCIALTGAGAVLHAATLVWGGLFLLAVLTAGGLTYINKSKRFKK